MARRKAKKTNTTADRHKAPRESFHLPEALRQALLDFLQSQRPRPGKSEVMRVALEEYLKKHHHWPPKE